MTSYIINGRTVRLKDGQYLVHETVDDIDINKDGMPIEDMINALNRTVADLHGRWTNVRVKGWEDTDRDGDRTGASSLEIHADRYATDDEIEAFKQRDEATRALQIERDEQAERRAAAEKERLDQHALKRAREAFPDLFR